MSPIEHESGAVSFVWYPDMRVLHWWFAPGCSLSELEGAAFAEAERLISADEDFRFLVDGAGVTWADIHYRGAAAEMFRSRRDTMRFAVFGLPAPIVMMAKMLFSITGVQATACHDRATAQAFLGIPDWSPAAPQPATTP